MVRCRSGILPSYTHHARQLVCNSSCHSVQGAQHELLVAPCDRTGLVLLLSCRPVMAVVMSQNYRKRTQHGHARVR
eukprot:353000-Chlamydomonas_euryale.AAC.16